MSSASLYNLQREGKEPRVEQSPQLLVQSFSRGRWYKQLPPRDHFSACFFPFCAECFKHQKENKLRESSSSEEYRNIWFLGPQALAGPQGTDKLPLPSPQCKSSLQDFQN